MRLAFSIRLNSLTFLISFNLLMFLLPVCLTVLFAQQVDEAYGLFLFLLGGLQGSWVLAGEVWRLLTAAFLHVDLLHLTVNMVGLYQLGRIIYSYYGGKILFFSYILCGIAGGVLSLVMTPSIATVGASGAVFGLMGVLLAGSMKSSRYGLNLPFGTWDILPLVVYAFLAGIVPGSPVNNWAHLGGFLCGLLIGRVFDHKLNLFRQTHIENARDALYYLSIVLFVGAYIWMVISIPAQLGLTS